MLDSVFMAVFFWGLASFCQQIDGLANGGPSHGKNRAQGHITRHQLSHGDDDHFTIALHGDRGSPRCQVDVMAPPACG